MPFVPSEFQAFIQKAFSTVDLIFADSIDWQAFFQSFQELRSRYDNLSIQAIEKKSGSAFVIRLEVPPEADKTAIEHHAKELYEVKLQFLEKRYRVELQAREREIEIYKQQSINIDRIVELLARREEPKVSLHPNQIKILQAVQGGACSSNNVANAVNLPIGTVQYYLEEMSREGYLRYDCSYSGDSIRLTNKGSVALSDPELLLFTFMLRDALLR